MSKETPLKICFMESYLSIMAMWWCAIFMNVFFMKREGFSECLLTE